MKSLLRNTVSVILVALMTFCADLLDETEIIFPEIGALCIGLWVIDKPVWKIRRWQIPMLFTLAATIGVLLVRFVPLSLPMRLEIGFAIIALLLMGLNASMTPAISACMLPVLMGTESWIYPLTVLILTTLLTVGQWLMERFHLRHVQHREPSFSVPPSYLDISLRWLALMLILLPIMLVTTRYGWQYAMVPPLIVTLVEFSNSASGFRDRPFQIWFTLIACALLGALAEGLLHHTWGLPHSLTAILTSAVILLFFHFSHYYFAPAFAIALVPMIIPFHVVPLYPLYVTFGSAYFILMAKICFSRRMKFWS